MNVTDGTIHYMIVKRYLSSVNSISLWNTVYHFCEFENSDFITLHSLYELITSVDIDNDDISVLKDMLLYILFECTDYINY